ncbi:MAG TPA: ATP-binding cassette domain-containing protein [Planctomycetota bacterium]|nr:ATP-binding cassette domain-containing protein [Planctomycetota bacterium]
MTEALQLHDLCFDYGRRPAVRHVSLSLAPGDCYGFLGHNGAGKTTVMRLCLGLLRPRRGTVRLLGLDALRTPRQARAGVGALVERPGFHLHASAQQNLLLLGKLQGLPRRLAAAESARVLERLGLAGVASQRVGTFSLGMRQRLGIAQALLGRPRLLLLDEPGNGLDPEGIADLRTLLLQLSRDEGTAVLLSSHQLQELEGLCNRIGVLREGAMVVEGDLESLRARLGARHVVAGTPIAALQQRLTTLGLSPVLTNGRLLVELDGQPPGAVARALTAVAELTTFGPEPTTLEAIYLRATRHELHAAPQPPPPAPRATNEPVPAAMETMGTTAHPYWRAFLHEVRLLAWRRTSLPALLVPCAVAAWSVFAYRHRVERSLASVRAGELFSADAGSGHLAAAQALQAATPVLALFVLWFASQSVAADLAGDTLRNTLVRSLQRGEVLLGKFAALAVATCCAWFTLCVATLVLTAMLLGFGDLEEVSRHGDRQVLAAAADIGPLLRLAERHCLLPLLATAAIGLLASALTRRPARALALAGLLALGPEVLRERLRDHAGWLLTSHLPTGLRDDSVLGFVAASARGAADALWPWASQAVLAPLLWGAVAVVLAVFVFGRRRVP